MLDLRLREEATEESESFYILFNLRIAKILQHAL